MDESLIEKQNGNFAKPVLGAVPSVVYNEDCVEGLKRFYDNYFDLAIVDPPYGIGRSGQTETESLSIWCKGKKSDIRTGQTQQLWKNTSLEFSTLSQGQYPNSFTSL